MKKYKINKHEYTLKEDYKNGFDLDAVTTKFTDYFDNYDYVIGDWSYGKLRLKGFCKKTNKIYKKINDYDNLDNYINNNCAYGCRYFVLERLKGNKEDK
jgi:uncharacterized protein YutD